MYLLAVTVIKKILLYNCIVEPELENRLYGTWEIFGMGKFWRTIQVKAIGKEKFRE